jgi:hypothetical protein
MLSFLLPNFENETVTSFLGKKRRRTLCVVVCCPRLRGGDMGHGKKTRLTKQDIARLGGLDGLIKELVKKITSDVAEAKEAAAAQLRCLGEQNHGQHQDALFNAGAIPPLVGLLVSGSANAQASSAGALNSIMGGKKKHQVRSLSLSLSLSRFLAARRPPRPPRAV